MWRNFMPVRGQVESRVEILTKEERIEDLDEDDDDEEEEDDEVTTLDEVNVRCGVCALLIASISFSLQSRLTVMKSLDISFSRES